MSVIIIDGSRVSSVHPPLSFCDSVRTIKPKWLKLNLPNLAVDTDIIHRPPMNIRSKVKVTGSQSVKALLLADRILVAVPLASLLYG